MDFNDIFYQFDIEGRIVMFPKAVFTDLEGLKAGKVKFDLKQTSKGAWLAILPVEELKIKFKTKTYKREE